MTDRYFINCRICDMQVSLIQVDSDDFVCPKCETHYYSEDSVLDRVVAEEMHKLFIGATRAGLIDEGLRERSRHRTIKELGLDG